MRRGLTARLRRSREEWSLFLRAWLTTAIARTALMLLPLASVRRIVHRLLRVSAPLRAAQRRPVGEIAWAAAAAGKYSPVGSTCLATALVAHALLTRHGHAARVRIGVRRDEQGKFAAHAWVERDGQVLVGGPAAVIGTYTPLPDMEHLLA